MEGNQFIWEFLVAGGPTMIALVASSVASMSIIFYKLFDLRRTRFLDTKEIKNIKGLIAREEYEKTRDYCIEYPGVFTNIVRRALEARQGGESAIREAIEEAGRYEVPKIERWLGPLRTIAAIAPLMGLFGTVVGMIRVFNEIGEVGLGQVSSFSGGISEALITTATGLAIAIPTLIMYNFFVDKSESIVLDVERYSTDVMRQLLTSESANQEAK